MGYISTWLPHFFINIRMEVKLMKKIFGSGWMRFILVLIAYVCYFIFIPKLSSNSTYGTYVLLANLVLSIICGWKFVRHIDTSAGAFMVVIKLVTAAFAGVFVLPYVIASIPYRICNPDDTE